MAELSWPSPRSVFCALLSVVAARLPISVGFEPERVFVAGAPPGVGESGFVRRLSAGGVVAIQGSRVDVGSELRGLLAYACDIDRVEDVCLVVACGVLRDDQMCGVGRLVLGGEGMLDVGEPQVSVSDLPFGEVNLGAIGEPEIKLVGV